MALQHFYARVPSRVSMYNKADGFDTFAASAGVTRDFAEKELAPLYEIKFSPQDAETVRLGNMAPVYCGFTTKSGAEIKSAIRFLPKDYSGERSAFFIHSLILSEEEIKSRQTPNASPIDPAVFLPDLSSFDIVGSTAKPNREYPEKELPIYEARPMNRLCEDYDAETVHRLLYAVLAAVCGKLKSVFVTVPNSSEEGTDFLCGLFNALLGVLPYHLRPYLPYATGVLNSNQYPSFKLKGIVGDPMTLQVNRSAVIGLPEKAVNGLNEKEYAEIRPLTEFFYSLLSREDLRRAFLAFSANAVKEKTSLANATYKDLADLIFLFRSGCDLCEEQTVLPNDDKVLDMVTLYESHRASMPDEYRIRAISSVKRYSAASAEIPKKIFSKLSKLYPSEIVGTRHIIMNVSLDLIHTDVMREKLFSFVKSAYASEDDETKASILHHLCGIFYGGFLQPQILAFFRQTYLGASSASQQEILDKVLLAIRTKALRPALAEFLDCVYPSFDPAKKQQTFDAISEQLPEGDELAQTLVEFCDRQLPAEEEAVTLPFRHRLFAILEAEQRKEAHPLLLILCATNGYCKTALEERLLSSWSNRKIFSEYLKNILGNDLTKALQTAERLYARSASWREGVEKRFSATIKECVTRKNITFQISELMQFDKAVTAKKIPFFNDLMQTTVRPLLAANLTAVFQKKQENVTVEGVLSYGKKLSEISASDGYRILSSYVILKKGITDADAALVATSLQVFSKVPRVFADLFGYLKKDLPTQQGASLGLYLLTASFLQKGTNGFESVAEELVNIQFEREGKGKAPTLATWQNAGVFELFFSYAAAVDRLPDAEELKKALYAEPGLGVLFQTVAEQFGSKAIRMMENCLKAVPADAPTFQSYAERSLADARKFGGFFHRLFKK